MLQACFQRNTENRKPYFPHWWDYLRAQQQCDCNVTSRTRPEQQWATTVRATELYNRRDFPPTYVQWRIQNYEKFPKFFGVLNIRARTKWSGYVKKRGPLFAFSLCVTQPGTTRWGETALTRAHYGSREEKKITIRNVVEGTHLNQVSRNGNTSVQCGWKR